MELLDILGWAAVALSVIFVVILLVLGPIYDIWRSMK